jgi:hypothetical protein
MSTDQSLFKDPAQAAQILASLIEKDKDDKICRYPTCPHMRQATIGTGRPSAYCDDTEHNAVNNHRARQQLKAAVASITTEATSKREASPTPSTAPVESLRNSRNSVLNQITLLQSNLERYVTSLAEMSDPDVSAAHIQAALDQANTRIAEAQQMVSTEQALHLAAETTLLAAQQEARSEREAAEQAIEHMEEVETNAQRRIEEAERRMEEVEANAQRRIEEAERHIEEIQRDRDAALKRMHIETQQQIANMEQQTREAIAQAQTVALANQEEARLANAAAQQARTQATTAERLENEAHASLERERAEIDRLRKELAETVTEARRRTEADRVEAQALLKRERAEIDRLREDLALARKLMEQATTRADKLATANDELRTQLMQSQMKQRTHTNQQQ